MKKAIILAIILILCSVGTAFSLPGKGNQDDRGSGRSEGRHTGSVIIPDAAQYNQGPLSHSNRSSLGARMTDTTETTESVHGTAKGKDKFELNGSIVSTDTTAISVLVEAGTKSIMSLKGKSAAISLTGATKIILKGKKITPDDLKVGDRVHVGGTIDSSLQLTASRVIVRPRNAFGKESHETSSTVGTGKESTETTSSETISSDTASSDATTSAVLSNAQNRASSVITNIAAKFGPKISSLFSWLRSVL